MIMYLDPNDPSKGYRDFGAGCAWADAIQILNGSSTAYARVRKKNFSFCRKQLLQEKVLFHVLILLNARYAMCSLFSSCTYPSLALIVSPHVRMCMCMYI
jgi:hypothetical protein